MSRDYTPFGPGRFSLCRTVDTGRSLRQMQQPDRTHSSAHHSRADDPCPFSRLAPAHYTRSRAYRLRGSEIQTLAELGMFRPVGTADLARHAYQREHEDMQGDIRNLARQGLIRQKTCEGPNANPRELLTLTKEGSKLLRANRLFPEDQAAYYGFVKPKEAQSPRSRPSYRIRDTRLRSRPCRLGTGDRALPARTACRQGPSWILTLGLTR
jgi:hypothetical protein